MTNRRYLLGGMLVAALLPGCLRDQGSADTTSTGGGGNGGDLSTGGGGNETSSGTGGSGTSASTGTGTGGGPGLMPQDACPDSAQIVKAIEEAKSGETIELGICTIQGPVRIHPGVTVRGKGIGQSFITSKAGTFAVDLMPGVPAALLAGVTVVANGTAAVASKGAGEVELEDVEVQLVRGVGVAAEGLTKLSLTRVLVTGQVTQRTVYAYPAEVAPKNASTHGVIALNIPSVELTDVTLTGLADFGAAFLGSDVTWTNGGASETLGTGLVVVGGSAKLNGISLCSAYQGNRKAPAVNGAFTTGAKITSNGLKVCDGGGLGLLHVNATAVHKDLTATGNAGPGVWVQKSPSFELGGAANLIDKNRLAGMVFVDVLKVKLANAKISNTAMVTLPFGENGAGVALGDGLQLIRSATAVSFEGVGFSGNAHTGLQIDLGPNDLQSPLFHMKWTGVTADASGSAYGALCQGSPGGIGEVWGPSVMGWDTGILRTGAAAINDGLVIDPNDRVGVIDPNDIPSPVSLLKNGGLAGVGVIGL